MAWKGPRAVRCRPDRIPRHRPARQGTGRRARMLVPAPSGGMGGLSSVGSYRVDTPHRDRFSESNADWNVIDKRQ